MRRSARIVTLTLAGAFTLAALAGPAAANVPVGVDTSVNTLNGNSLLNANKVQACGIKAAGIGLDVPIASSESAGCAQP
ncbi:hypothetical protein ACU635_39020 [[Actinomadura] parvosata]|uniref:Chaplin n=1 Tax=Nonomuraea composti TaxID=2720023 RepID=A0ABX1BGY2_9ACTN|nr:hypothetical protein [Nonomuraea sp. FMUSA5-5]NJP95592.1 hypothetical protein [Nonomuraea sp. FMUSA5-5]